MSVTNSHGCETAAEVTSDCSSDEEDRLLEPRFKYQRIEGPDAKQVCLPDFVFVVTITFAFILLLFSLLSYFSFYVSRNVNQIWYEEQS